MRILITCFLFSISIALSAQDYPQFSQHVNLQGLINPAYNGSRESYSALLVSRNQWGGAVTTHALNAHAPLPIDGMGGGLVVMQDNIGLNSSLRTVAGVSYHLKISKDVILAAGLQGGFERNQVGDASLINPNDMAVDEFGRTTTRLSTGLGFYLYSPDYFAGLSLPEILPDGVAGDGTVYNDIPLLLYGGVLLDAIDDVILKPTAFLQMTYATPLMLELGVQAFYKDYGSVGISTRAYPFSSVVFNTEVKIIDNLFVGYSYDLMFGASQGMTKGAHEISIRYDISAINLLTKPAGSMRYF